MSQEVEHTFESRIRFSLSIWPPILICIQLLGDRHHTQPIPQAGDAQAWTTALHRRSERRVRRRLSRARSRDDERRCIRRRLPDGIGRGKDTADRREARDARSRARRTTRTARSRALNAHSGGARHLSRAVRRALLGKNKKQTKKQKKTKKGGGNVISPAMYAGLFSIRTNTKKTRHLSWLYAGLFSA